MDDNYFLSVDRFLSGILVDLLSQPLQLFAYKKVKNAETQKLENETHVTEIVEPTEHFSTQAVKKSKKLIQ